MSRDKAAYQIRLDGMLPPGIKWRFVDPRIARLLLGLGSTGARVDADVVSYEAGTVPTRATGDDLAAWEAALALPDGDRPAVDPGDTAARQAAVAAALDQSQTATPALFVALGVEWGIAVRPAEYEAFPYEVWIYGPEAHVKAFRVGSSTISEPLLWQSDTWKSLWRLIQRYQAAHLRFHAADDVGT